MQGLESILVDKIMEYFKSNNLLSNNEFDFIKSRSVSIQLINLLDKWTKHLDNKDNKGIDVIFILTLKKLLIRYLIKD